MQCIDYRIAMLTRKDKELTQIPHLAKIASRWDRAINRGLRQFAQCQWPDIHLLGLVPIHSFRLRKQLESETIVWWVERDIPPTDLYRCEAYRVELSLAEPGQPQLIVRSGKSKNLVVPMTIEGLKIALVQAAADTPLVIRREFGLALEP